MNIYAESSAILAWLLGEVTGSRVREALLRAELVFSSDLVLIECDRIDTIIFPVSLKRG